MDIILNGEKQWIVAGMTLAGLLEQLGLDPRKVAVECNLEIVPKSVYGEKVLQPGDRLEIVEFVGGG